MQWRAYGSVAIGVNPLIFTASMPLSRVGFVEYDIAKQESMLRVFLNHIRQAVNRDLSAAEGGRILGSATAPDVLLGLLAFFKDDSFSTEKEVRLLFVENELFHSDAGIGPIPKRFRVSNKRIIPYMTTTDAVNKHLNSIPFPLEEVVLGPGSDGLLERGVRELLDANGFPNAQIRSSALPFRA